MARRESDQLIVLGDGRADHRGKGLTEVRSWQRKHCPARRAGLSNANLTAGNSKEGSRPEGVSFLNLYRLIDENLLLDCWRDIRKNAAYGVDRVSAQEYAQEPE